MMLKIQFSKNLALIFAAIIVLFASCKSGNQSTHKDSIKADSLGMKEISQNVKDVVYPLPTPFEMTDMLNTMGAKYSSAILNPPDHAEKYFTEKSKAVNVGVYGADLAYATTYDQKQDVKNYSKALKSLIDQLGINVNYNKLLAEDATEKLNNKDTLVSVITNLLYDTYKF